MGKKKNDNDKSGKTGFTRRGFISTVGAGAVAAATVSGVSHAKEKGKVIDDSSRMVVLNINGRNHKVHVENRYTLLFVLRDILGLVGTKVGCERGECGSCSVLIDGVTRYSCLTLAVEAEGHEVTTVEGLMDGEELGIVQQAFVEEDAFQCGFCTPGQVVAMEGMLRKNPSPGIEEIKEGMSGNLCRCGAYKHIFNAAQNASEKLRGKGGSQ